MNRYFSSFFITTILYLIGTFFLFYTFADILIVEEKKQEELKISLSHVIIHQEQTSTQTISEPIIEPEPLEKVPTPIKKKIEKPKKENIQKKVVEKKEIEKPIENQNLLTDTTKNENQESDLPNEIKQTKVDTKEYVDKNLALIRSLINQNVKYPSKAKKLSIEGIVVVKFKILEDGRVENIEIIEGHALLRSSTIEAIEEASKSFPKSEMSIEIQIPIEYKLI
jgi:protein TonB